MKILTLIIHTDAQQEMTNQLRNLQHVSGFTITHVEGHGVEIEGDPFLAARDKVVGISPRVRVDILLDDADTDIVLTMLINGKANITGQSVYWITPVEKFGHL